MGSVKLHPPGGEAKRPYVVGKYDGNALRTKITLPGVDFTPSFLIITAHANAGWMGTVIAVLTIGGYTAFGMYEENYDLTPRMTHATNNLLVNGGFNCNSDDVINAINSSRNTYHFIAFQ